jgi:hypothetical protein
MVVAGDCGAQPSSTLLEEAVYPTWVFYYTYDEKSKPFVLDKPGSTDENTHATLWRNLRI